MRLEPLRKLEGRVLVVDDLATNRTLLAHRLEGAGLHVTEASDGTEALRRMSQEAFDLVFLDVMMPGLDGIEVLERMKTDPALLDIPVLMISAVGDIEYVVRCLELGAEDYLSKPFEPVVLRARVSACLERKRHRDQEKEFLRRLSLEQQRSERLLLNVLPRQIAARLKDGETIADSFAEVTVAFADLVGFTELSDRLPPVELVALLDEIFSRFDTLADRHGLEKIKTIGDAYLIAGGIPQPRADHAEAVAEMALDMLDALGELGTLTGRLQLRIGLSSGSVIAGVIGRKKFIYDLWGDTVNTASRMESHGLPGRVQVSAATAALLADRFRLEPRGTIEVKGKGPMPTSWLLGRKDAHR